MKPLLAAGVAELLPIAAHAQRFESEIRLGGAIRGGLESAVVLVPGARFGFVLGERSVLLIGVSASVSESDPENPAMGLASRSRAVSLPVELKLYLASPKDRGAVPLLRFGLGYEYGSRRFGLGFDTTSHGLLADAGAGVQYFFTKRFGVLAELGVTYARRYSTTTSGGLGGLGSSGGLGGFGTLGKLQPLTTESSLIQWDLGAAFSAAVVFRF